MVAMSTIVRDMGEKRTTRTDSTPKKLRVVKLSENTPMPKSAEELAKAIFHQADARNRLKV